MKRQILATNFQKVTSAAWNPVHTAVIACGFDTGAISIGRMQTKDSGEEYLKPFANIATGFSRPTRHVSFSAVDGNLLAGGFDRARNEHGLIIWNIMDSLVRFI